MAVSGKINSKWWIFQQTILDCQIVMPKITINGDLFVDQDEIGQRDSGKTYRTSMVKGRFE